MTVAALTAFEVAAAAREAEHANPAVAAALLYAGPVHEVLMEVIAALDEPLAAACRALPIRGRVAHG